MPYGTGKINTGRETSRTGRASVTGFTSTVGIEDCSVGLRKGRS